MSQLDSELVTRLQQLRVDRTTLAAESEESLANLEELVREAKAMKAAISQGQKAPVIHVVDDDEQFQLAILRLLRAAGYEARGYKNAGHFLLAKIEPGPGCILVDARMPGPSGLDLQEALAQRSQPLPIIFISGHRDVPTTVRAIKAGAVDFLTKPVQREVLLTVIRNALARDSEARAAREKLANWQACYHSLSARELEVFNGVVAGKMNKEIAVELGAAERTVKAHRAQVMEKMRAQSVAELVHIADQLKACRPTQPSQDSQRISAA